MSEKNIFSSLENIIDDQIPQCVVYILNESGFNSKIALKNIIPQKSIKQIEAYFNKNYEKLCCGLIGSIYENIYPFSIAPGHRILIESLSQYVDLIKTVNKSHKFNETSNGFSFVLKLLIETAEKNSGRRPTGHRFDENIQLFATYLYLMCGRSCYENLNANLPIPHANTICKRRTMLSLDGHYFNFLHL